MSVAWRENLPLFVSELEGGVLWQEAVAAVLRAYRLPAQAEALRVRAADQDPADFAQTQDVTVGTRAIEVKSCRYAFTTPESCPFPAMMVDTVDGWDAKQRKPCAVVLVSRPTAAMLVAPVSTQPSWVRITRQDRVRGITVVCYACPRELLRPMGELAAWLGGCVGA